METIIFCLLSAVVAQAKPFDASATKLRIKANGARRTAIELYQNSGAWADFSKAVKSGDARALEAAAMLREESEGSATLELDIMASVALTKNPDKVLSYLDKPFPAQRVCSVPFIEPTPAQERQFQTDAEAALRKVKGPQAAKARRCLRAIKAEPQVEAPTLLSLSQKICRLPPAEALKTLSPSSDLLDQFKNEIYTAEEGAIQCAEKLRPHATKEIAAELDRSLTFALNKKPETVLRYLNAVFTVENVCKNPYTDVTSREAWTKDLRVVFQKISDSKLKVVSGECLVRAERE